jgi:hypothetical protein
MHSMSDMSDPSRSPEPAPDNSLDLVIEIYKKNVDRTLLRENLKPSVDERFRKFESLARLADEIRKAGERNRPGH